MEDLNRPPKPDYDFDFNLPHGVDVEEATVPHHDQGLVDDPTDHVQDNLKSMENIQSTHGVSEDLIYHHYQDNTHQVIGVPTFEPGFSDDESGEEDFDRSWSARPAKKPPSPLKKSTRRLEDDVGDDEPSPTKKARQSLFGGPLEEGDVDEEHENSFGNSLHASANAEPDIGNGMSSLHIDSNRQNVAVQSTQGPSTLDARPRASTSERDSMSPPPSSLPSEDDFEIPPDNQVSMD